MTLRTGADFERAVSLAKLMKEEIKAKKDFTCFIDIEPNKVVAKVATDMRKPGSLTVVRPDGTPSFLFLLPASTLIGVGWKTTERLK